MKRLFDAGAASSSDLEAAEAQRSAAQAAVDNAVAMRNRAKEDAERLDVPSPITGWVSKVFVHGGDRTAVGDRLFTIVDNSDARAVGDGPVGGARPRAAGRDDPLPRRRLSRRGLRGEGRSRQSHDRTRHPPGSDLHAPPEPGRTPGRRALRQRARRGPGRASRPLRHPSDDPQGRTGRGGLSATRQDGLSGFRSGPGSIDDGCRRRRAASATSPRATRC